MRSRFLAIIPVVTLALVGATPAIASTDICAVVGGTLTITIPPGGDVEIESQEGALVVSSWDPDVACAASPVAVGAEGVTAMVVNGSSGGEAVTVTTTTHEALLGLASISFALGSGTSDAVLFLGTDDADAIDLVTGVSWSGVEIRMASGNGGDDVLVGTEVGDLLEGNDGDDALLGGGGDDYLVGGGGGDSLSGAGGRDLLSGGDGDDVLSGGGGSDQLTGDGGTDTLDGGGGRDLCSGEAVRNCP